MLSLSQHDEFNKNDVDGSLFQALNLVLFRSRKPVRTACPILKLFALILVTLVSEAVCNVFCSPDIFGNIKPRKKTCVACSTHIVP